jgi:hypothetical protein
VNKQIEPETDLGNLLIADINLFERKNFKWVLHVVLKNIWKNA